MISVRHASPTERPNATPMVATYRLPNVLAAVIKRKANTINNVTFLLFFMVY
ncbi:hypothetical protein [Bacillus thuringiensis]|uniref:hypothetical protein n=1 Tax=Bacillus thuringiensis TaxID=1428 RepID=UPI001596D0BA|nr:hypothetical protein [Bacillus thuringiensis]